MKQDQSIINMYSSCPNIIRHFIPNSFSQSVLDTPQSPTIVQLKPKPIQNPFTNMKLQKLKHKSQDFVLIFKNKTCKEYSPRKKVKYSGFIKEIASNIDKVQNISPGSKKREFLLNVQKQYRSKIKEESDLEVDNRDRQFQIIRPRTIDNMNKLRQFHPQIRQNNSSKQKHRIRFSGKYSSLRETRASFKSGKQSNTSSIRKEKAKVSDNRELDRNVNKILNFKIRGSQAPKQQTIDFFKKLAIDFNYKLAGSLVK